jgi:hypothetical protein
MTGYTRQYGEQVTEGTAIILEENPKPAKKKPAKPRAQTQEDEEIIEAVNVIRRELDFLHNRYDNTSDAILIESLIYEIKAAHMKYQYYLNLCKDKGIVCHLGK